MSANLCRRIVNRWASSFGSFGLNSAPFVSLRLWRGPAVRSPRSEEDALESIKVLCACRGHYVYRAMMGDNCDYPACSKRLLAFTPSSIRDYCCCSHNSNSSGGRAGADRACDTIAALRGPSYARLQLH